MQEEEEDGQAAHNDIIDLTGDEEDADMKTVSIGMLDDEGKINISPLYLSLCFFFCLWLSLPLSLSLSLFPSLLV